MSFTELESHVLLPEPNARVKGQPSITRRAVELCNEDVIVIVQCRIEKFEDLRGIAFRLHEPGRFQNPEAVPEQSHLGLKLRVALFGFVKIVGDDVECGEKAHVYLVLGVAVFVREVVADYGTERPFACSRRQWK